MIPGCRQVVGTGVEPDIGVDAAGERVDHRQLCKSDELGLGTELVPEAAVQSDGVPGVPVGVVRKPGIERRARFASTEDRADPIALVGLSVTGRVRHQVRRTVTLEP